MSAPEQSVLKALAIKAEATAGTFSTPTMAADAVRILRPGTIAWGHAIPGLRTGVVTGGYGRPPSAPPTGRWLRIELEMELVGSGTAATAPKPGFGLLLDPFMAEAVTTVVDYSFSATQKKTFSVLAQDGGKEFEGRGMVPTRLMLRGPVDDGRILIAATIEGILNIDPVEQALEAQTYNNQAATPLIFGGATVMTVGGTALIVRSFELDFRLQARPWRVNRNVAGNLVHGIVTQANPIIRCPAEVDALATHNPFTRQSAPQTALAFSLTLGSAAGNKYVITADHVEYDPNNIGWSEEDMLRMYDLELGFPRPSGGNWFKISHQ